MFLFLKKQPIESTTDSKSFCKSFNPMMQKYAVMIKNSGNNCSKNRIYSSKQLNPLLKKLFI